MIKNICTPMFTHYFSGNRILRN